MKTVGIVCEYNPFHNGHALQFQKLRAALGQDAAIVCAMSGNFVQRGAPAIFDKSLRAEAALKSGADLVLELPTAVSLSSAEGFAAGGVRLLSQLCDILCFGAEDTDADTFMQLAEAQLCSRYSEALKAALATGCSFPAARDLALQAMGLNPAVLQKPNNTLAVEYCKAILSQGSKLEILPVTREGSYHDTLPHPEHPAATAIRGLLEAGADCGRFMPPQAGAVHSLQYGQRAILARLRTMTDEEFEALPYGSEGLWRKLMHESRRQADLESILTAVKSKRYTRSRLDRMVMCAFLGLRQKDLETAAPYVRILGFTDTGREILKGYHGSIPLKNAGEKVPGDYCEKEMQIGSLYGLFSAGVPEAPDWEAKRRIVYPGGQRNG